MKKPPGLIEQKATGFFMFMFIRISDPVFLSYTLFDCNERTDYLSRMYFSVSS